MSSDKNYIVSKRYAQALVDFAKDEIISFDEISANLTAVLFILSHSKEVYMVLTNPLIDMSSKEDIVEKIFERDVNTVVINFLKLLVSKNRFDLIYEITEIYNSLLDEINQVARIEVVSAIDLDDVEKLKIKDKLSEKLQKEVSVKYEIDKSIIAGLVIKYGDKVADMSVAHKIDEYRAALV